MPLQQSETRDNTPERTKTAAAAIATVTAGPITKPARAKLRGALALLVEARALAFETPKSPGETGLVDKAGT